MSRNYFDSHIHSCRSNDSTQTVSAICESALRKGLQGIAITDHANMTSIIEDQTFENISASIKDAKDAASFYADSLKVFVGVEVSEADYNRHNTQAILNLTDYDVVLASVHKIQFGGQADYYSKICFDENFSQKALYDYMGVYFETLLRTAEREDYDVLAHLTCPLRYINGKYRRGINLDLFRETIDEILLCLIRRKKALEVNTSGIHGIYNHLMPDLDVIQRYFELGGRLITLGSDAHTPENLGNYFEETAGLLMKMGFAGYYFFEERIPYYSMF